MVAPATAITTAADFIGQHMEAMFPQHNAAFHAAAATAQSQTLDLRPQQFAQKTRRIH
jgi:hypothetical protein